MPSPWPGAPWVPTSALRDRILTRDEWNETVDVVKALCDTFGLSPQGAFGSVLARLDSLAGTVEALTVAAQRNLRIDPVTGGTAYQTQVRIRADALAIETAYVEPVDVTLTITTTGKNGLDAGAGTEAADTWYAVWIGRNPDTAEVAGVLSVSFTQAGLTLDATLDGFTQWRRVGARRNDHLGHLIPATQSDAMVLYEGFLGNLTSHATQPGLLRLAGGTAITKTTVTLGALLPPTAIQAYLHLGLFTSANGGQLVLFPGGGVLDAAMLAGPVLLCLDGGNVLTHTWVTAVDQEVGYVLLPTGSGLGANIAVLGYLETF